MYPKNVLLKLTVIATLGASSLFIYSCSEEENGNTLESANILENQTSAKDLDDDNDDDDDSIMKDPEKMEGKLAKVKWNYSDKGPDVWATLSTDFEKCGSGTEQSPINLTPANIVKTGPGTGLTFNYKIDSKLVALNNTHTNEFKVEKGSSVTFNGRVFNLAQFHGHADSEHELDGEQSPLELHFVHVAADGSGELLVVGVLIDEGDEDNANYASFWKDENFLETQAKSVERDVAGVHDLSKLLPTNSALYQYKGSLTTPPCSEGVNWNVLVEKITMSEDQLELFTDIFDDNFRPVQKLNAREVTSTEDTTIASLDK